MSMHVAVAGWLLGPDAHSGANRRLSALLREAHAWLQDGERVTVLHGPQLTPPRRFERIEWRAVDIPSGPTWRRAVAEHDGCARAADLRRRSMPRAAHCRRTL